MRPRYLTLSTPILFTLLILNLASADYQAGLNAYKDRDYPNALKELRPLAVEGDVLAQDILAMMYYFGLGVSKDRMEAERWFRLAAEQEHMIAQRFLGRMYRLGKGVPQDFPEAMQWYRRAAEQGDCPSQFNLGRMYAEGLGAPPDKVKAYMWYSIGYAQDRADKLAQRMTSEEVAEAKGLIREWKPRPSRPYTDYCYVHFPTGTEGCPQTS